jgi:hypothetical protein
LLLVRITPKLGQIFQNQHQIFLKRTRPKIKFLIPFMCGTKTHAFEKQSAFQTKCLKQRLERIRLELGLIIRSRTERLETRDLSHHAVLDYWSALQCLCTMIHLHVTQAIDTLLMLIAARLHLTL